MTYQIVADRQIDEQAWFDGRTRLVTATDAATLIRGGAGAWSAIRAEKNGERRNFQNRATTHGTEREPIISAYAEDTYGLIPCTALLINPDYPQYGASPDSITRDGTLVGEVKTTVHDWDGWDDVPPRYRDQMLWQMFVTGARRGKLIYEPHEDWVPIYPFPKVLDLDYDEARVTELRAIADQFLSGGGEPSIADLRLDQLLVARVEAKERVDVAQAAVDELDELIRDQINNEPTRFEGSLANLTLSADTVQERFDSAGFKKAQPDVYSTFTKSIPVRGRMTITLRKDS